MTLTQILSVIKENLGDIVEISLIDGSKIRGLLMGAYKGNINDPRGYNEDYCYIIRVDQENQNPTKYNCSQILNVKRSS